MWYIISSTECFENTEFLTFKGIVEAHSFGLKLKSLNIKNIKDYKFISFNSTNSRHTCKLIMNALGFYQSDEPEIFDDIDKINKINENIVLIISSNLLEEVCKKVKNYKIIN